MDKHHPSELLTAVYENDENAVVRLLRGGVSAETADRDGQTVLYLAAVSDEPGIVRLLLTAGADPDRLSAGTDAPLCGASVGGHLEVVRALLAAGATPDLAEEGGFRAVTWAVQRGQLAVLRELLTAGADPDLLGPHGEPPLVTAARRGSPGCVRALLQHGATAWAEALTEARRWLTLDVATELRAGLEAAYGPGEYVTRRLPETADDAATITVELLRGGRLAAGTDQQTGHGVIVGLLAGGWG